MKVEEALFKCKYEIYFDCGTEDEDDLENIVIQALEKQIPKKLNCGMVNVLALIVTSYSVLMHN